MMGNCHVRFLGEGRGATLNPYPLNGGEPLVTISASKSSPPGAGVKAFPRMLRLAIKAKCAGDK